MSTTTMLQLYEDLADDLDRIRARFKSPKLTLVIRAPQLADGDIVMSDDDLGEAIAAIRKLQERDPMFKKECR